MNKFDHKNYSLCVFNRILHSDQGIIIAGHLHLDFLGSLLDLIEHLLGSHLDFKVVEVDLIRQETFLFLFFGGSGEFAPFI
jgi:hypothetical protein